MGFDNLSVLPINHFPTVHGQLGGKLTGSFLILEHPAKVVIGNEGLPNSDCYALYWN